MTTTAPDVTRILPGLEPVQPGLRTSVSTAVARRLFAAAMSRLDVTVEDRTTGRLLGRGGPRMVLNRPDEFFARVGRDGLIGFGEAWLTGAWDSDDLAGFLTVPAARMATLVPPSLQRLRALVTHRSPEHQRSTQDNSRANIAHHYDLSNELFALFLDDTLSYSSALFDASLVAGHTPGLADGHTASLVPSDTTGLLVATPPEATSALDTDSGGQRVHKPDLAAAQRAKLDRLLDSAGVTAGSRVLEIGTGWGELAIRAAGRGARVHSITLSSEQRDLALARIETAGLSEAIEVELCDYRDLGEQHVGAYDAVLSVEMIEAVGHEFWATYFKALDRALAPGGTVAIQAITMPHDRMLATRDTHTWITKYVFPGGFLPSVQVLDRVTREHTSLRMRRRLSFGSHYAETLRRWEELFLARAREVEALGGDEVFRRMWQFYLAYSRAGFAAGYIDVNQITFTREAA